MLGFYMSGDNPVGLYSGKTLPAGLRPCTEDDKVAYSAVGPMFKGTSTYRWTFIDSVLADVVDDRVTGTWSDTGTQGVADGDGDLHFDLVVGDAEPILKLTLSATAFNGSIIATLAPSGQELKFSFTAGVATVPIDTSKASKYSVEYTSDAKLLNKVFVRISETKLYPV